MSKRRTSKKHAHHDLEPPSGRDGLERREAARGNIGELQVLRHREVARQADAGLNRDHVEKVKHRGATVPRHLRIELALAMLIYFAKKEMRAVKIDILNETSTLPPTS